jgi:hypothetical protein
MPKLNQILAIEKGVKNRVKSNMTKLYHASQKPALFDGLDKKYQPKDEDGETYPPEHKEIQFRAHQVIKQTRQNLTELFNTTATKDWANCEARADIEIDGQTILNNVPVTYLLFLEKQVEDLITSMTAMPTLDSSMRWSKDEAAGTHYSDEIVTHKGKKVEEPITVIEPTEHQPGQFTILTKDVIVGHWTTVHQSGRMRAAEKEEIQDRLVKLQKAIKQAREAANSIEASHQQVAEPVLDYIFG